MLLPPFSEELPDWALGPPDWALGPPDWETGSARLAWVDRTSSVASGKNLAGISGCSTYIILDESQAFDGRPSQAFIRAMQRNLIARREGGGGWFLSDTNNQLRLPTSRGHLLCLSQFSPGVIAQAADHHQVFRITAGRQDYSQNDQSIHTQLAGLLESRRRVQLLAQQPLLLVFFILFFFISYCHIHHVLPLTASLSSIFWRHPCLHALRQFRADLVVSFSSVRGAKMILKLCGLSLFG